MSIFNVLEHEGDMPVDTAQENRALAAAAGRDREAMEGHIQTLAAQVRELQEALEDTSKGLDDSERALRSAETRNKERQAAVEELEKRLKAANAKQHELVGDLTGANAQMNKVKDAAYEDTKKKDDKILKLQEALEKERLLADEVRADQVSWVSYHYRWRVLWRCER